jgi:hypothetical protein
MLLPRTYRRAQLRLTSASDFQVETHECRVKIAFYTSKLGVLDCYQAPQQFDNLTDEGDHDLI